MTTHEKRFGKLFEEAYALGLIAGVCKTASAGSSQEFSAIRVLIR
jgi:hypothetical protein